MTDSTDDLDPIALYAIERVAEGETLTAIAGALGMTMNALHNRCRQNAELQRRYWAAKEMSAEPLEAELLDACRELALTNDKAARIKVAALQWLLSKRHPKRYGERLALDHASPDGSMSPKEAGPVDQALVAALVEKLTD